MIDRLLRHVRRLRDDRGSIAIAMALPVLLFVSLGLMTVDFGSWFAARRVSQTRADSLALAGAIELPSFDDPIGAGTRALAAVDDWAAANGLEPGDYDAELVSNCFSASDPVPTGVHVTVHRPTDTIFDLAPGGVVDIVADATACSGTPIDATGFMPWSVSSAGDCFSGAPDPADRTPLFGQRCTMVVGGGAAAMGAVGQLALDPDQDCPTGNGSANQYEDNVAYGADVLCSVGGSVADAPGVAVNSTRRGIQTRLESEGVCDALAASRAAEVTALTTSFNAQPGFDPLAAPAFGIDDFFEVFRPGAGFDPTRPAEHLQTIDCDPSTSAIETSPRNISVIVVDQVGTFDGSGCNGSRCYLIRGFARMYLEGCSTTGPIDTTCSGVGGGGTFTVYGRIVDAFGQHNGAVGLNRFGNVQTFLSR